MLVQTAVATTEREGGRGERMQGGENRSEGLRIVGKCPCCIASLEGVMWVPAAPGTERETRTTEQGQNRSYSYAEAVKRCEGGEEEGGGARQFRAGQAREFSRVVGREISNFHTWHGQRISRDKRQTGPVQAHDRNQIRDEIGGHTRETNMGTGPAQPNQHSGGQMAIGGGRGAWRTSRQESIMQVQPNDNENQRGLVTEKAQNGPQQPIVEIKDAFQTILRNLGPQSGCQIAAMTQIPLSSNEIVLLEEDRDSQSIRETHIGFSNNIFDREIQIWSEGGRGSGEAAREDGKDVTCEESDQRLDDGKEKRLSPEVNERGETQGDKTYPGCSGSKTMRETRMRNFSKTYGRKGSKEGDKHGGSKNTEGEKGQREAVTSKNNEREEEMGGIMVDRVEQNTEEGEQEKAFAQWVVRRAREIGEILGLDIGEGGVDIQALVKEIEQRRLGDMGEAGGRRGNAVANEDT